MANIIRDSQKTTQTLESDTIFTASATIAIKRDETYTDEADAGIVVSATMGGGIYNNVILTVNNNITVANDTSSTVRGIDAASTYTADSDHTLFVSNNAYRTTLKIARKSALDTAASTLGIDAHKTLDFSSGNGDYERFLTSFNLSQTNTGDAFAAAIRAEKINLYTGFESAICVNAKSSNGDAEAVGFDGSLKYNVNGELFSSAIPVAMTVCAQSSASGKTAEAALFRAATGSVELSDTVLNKALKITAKSAKGGASAAAFEAGNAVTAKLSGGLTVSATGDRAGVQTADQVNAYGFHTTLDGSSISASSLTGNTSIAASNRSGKAGAYLFFAQGDGSTLRLDGQLDKVSVTASGATGFACIGSASESISIGALIAGTAAVSAKSTAGAASAYGFSTTGTLALNENILRNITISASAAGADANADASAFYARKGLQVESRAVTISGGIKVSASSKSGDASASVFECDTLSVAGETGISLGCLSGDLAVSASAAGSASAVIIKSFDPGTLVGYSVAVQQKITGKLTASAKGAGDAVEAAIVNSGADGNQSFSQEISSAATVSATNTGTGSASAIGFNGKNINISGDVNGRASISALAKGGSASAYFLKGEKLQIDALSLACSISVSAQSTDGAAEAVAFQAASATGTLDFFLLDSKIVVSAKSTNGTATAHVWSDLITSVSGSAVNQDISVTAISGGAAVASGLGGNGTVSLETLHGKITVKAESKKAAAVATGLGNAETGRITISALTRDLTVSASGAATGYASDAVSTLATGIGATLEFLRGITGGKITVSAKDSGSGNGIVRSVGIGNTQKNGSLSFANTINFSLSSTAANTGSGSAEAYGFACGESYSIDAAAKITVSASAKNNSALAYGFFFSYLNASMLSPTFSVKASGAGAETIACAFYTNNDMNLSRIITTVSVIASDSKGKASAYGFLSNGELNIQELNSDLTVSATGKNDASAYGFMATGSSGIFINEQISKSVKVTAKSSGGSGNTIAAGWQSENGPLTFLYGMSGNLTVSASSSFGTGAVLAMGIGNNSAESISFASMSGKISVSASGASDVYARGIYSGSGNIIIQFGIGAANVSAKTSSTNADTEVIAYVMQSSGNISISSGSIGNATVSSTASAAADAGAGFMVSGGFISADTISVSHSLTVSASSGTVSASANAWYAVNAVNIGSYAGKISVSATAKAGEADASFITSQSESVYIYSGFSAAVTVKASGKSAEESVKAYGFHAGADVRITSNLQTVGSVSVTAENASGAAEAYGVLAKDNLFVNMWDCGKWVVKTGKGDANSIAVGWSVGGSGSSGTINLDAETIRGSISVTSSTGSATGISGTFSTEARFSIDVTAVGKTSAVALDLKNTERLVLEDCSISAKVTDRTGTAYAIRSEYRSDITLNDGAKVTGNAIFAGTESNSLTMFSGSGLSGDVDMTASDSDSISLFSGSLLDGSISGAEDILFYLDNSGKTGPMLRSDSLSGIASASVQLNVSSGLEGSFVLFSGKNGALDETTCFSSVSLGSGTLELNGIAVTLNDYDYSLRTDAKNSSVILDVSVHKS